jgi:hypothetical protein
MMSSRVLRVAAIFFLLLSLLSCNKINSAMKSVEGKVAGQVLNNAGRGRGYVQVVLTPTAGGDDLKTITEDSGNFLFEAVPPGEYTLKVENSGGGEILSDNPTVKVGPGRTMQQNVILKDVPAST